MWPEPASATLGFVTAVFVHGVPETSIVWDALREKLAGESLALALPGIALLDPRSVISLHISSFETLPRHQFAIKSTTNKTTAAIRISELAG